MPEQRTAVYEIMFLISQADAAYLADVLEHIDTLFQRCGATVLAMKKWDERRLAYEIDKQRRGYYLLAYFECDTRSIAQLERDCNLSEKILRKMIIKADTLTREQIEAMDGREELRVEAKMKSDRAAEQAASEGDASVTLGAPKKPEPETPTDAQSEEGASATAVAEAPEGADEPKPEDG